MCPKSIECIECVFEFTFQFECTNWERVCCVIWLIGLPPHQHQLTSALCTVSVSIYSVWRSSLFSVICMSPPSQFIIYLSLGVYFEVLIVLPFSSLVHSLRPSLHCNPLFFPDPRLYMFLYIFLKSFSLSLHLFLIVVFALVLWCVLSVCICSQMCQIKRI